MNYQRPYDEAIPQGQRQWESESLNNLSCQTREASSEAVHEVVSHHRTYQRVRFTTCRTKL